MSSALDASLEERVEIERVSPNDRDYNFQLHEDVYLYAARLAARKVVVDLGSGTGYGSSLLAKIGASKVLGFDYSDEAVEFSKRTFSDPKLTFVRAELNLPLSIECKADLVFSSNVFEHLYDIRQALANVIGILKPDGLFFLAVPAIQDEAHLEAESRNKFHTSNFSIHFWTETLKRCFDSVEVRIQSLLCPYFEVYLTLTEFEREKALSELSCFISMDDGLPFGDTQLMPNSYANVVFLCRHPRRKAEMADFSLCPVSHTRRLAYETGSLAGWSELFRDSDSLRQEVPFRGWLGGVELLLGHAGKTSWGWAMLEISVEDQGTVISKRSKEFELFKIDYSPFPAHWNFYREPIFIAEDQKLFVSITAKAKETGDVFAVAMAQPASDSSDKVYLRLFELLAPVC